MKRIIYILLSFFLSAQTAHSQAPHFLSFNTETGLPSNEVYSIVQDLRGFLWIGCDAGLYKFDGVRYTHYTFSTQKSKSITGLTLSRSGKIYCYNFQSQLFYIENDSLKEMNIQFGKINQLACNQNNELLVSHAGGLSRYSETTKRWVHFQPTKNSPIQITSSVIEADSNTAAFITSEGIGSLRNGVISLIKSDYCKPVGSLIMRKADSALFLFSIKENLIFKLKDGHIFEIKNTKLNQLLKDKKITNAVYLPDQHLWITTYKGIIRYNPKTEEVKLYYPNFSFSDCIIGRENNYWFSTLHNGLLCISDLEYLTWNNNHNNFGNEYITHLTSDNENLYYSSMNGTITRMNVTTYVSRSFVTKKNADVQSLDYDFTRNRLYFYSDNLYFLQNNKLLDENIDINVKSLFKIYDDLFIFNSYGVHVRGKENYKIASQWARESQYDTKQHTLWVATNEGILKCIKRNAIWQVVKILLNNIQILSIDFDDENSTLYSLTFDGQIFANEKKLAQLPNDVQVNKLDYFNNNIYVATIKGVWVFNIANNQWININSLLRLTSENIRDLLVLKGNLWLATSKGLQKVPLQRIYRNELAKVYLKRNIQKFKLNYGESLIIEPEASTYSSVGKFQYAYRINKQEWVKLPSSIEKIEIQNLPPGKITVELKVIDHHGLDSENSIELQGFVKPPYWLSCWFWALAILSFITLVLIIFNYQWKKSKKTMQVRNELNLSKLTAIKSQMNPHFIFNSLNSIQDLILKGDVEHSYSYISTFSNMVRATLNNSEREFIDIDQEIKLLELYLSLEKLRFKNEFDYEIQYDDNIDILVPPMLIQPFIENALVHGLIHKVGKKKICIQFQLGTTLQCIIEDNGIGRKAAQEIQKRQQRHESFASKAIYKRFEILSTVYKGEFGFRFEDIMVDNKVDGTRVILSMPFREKY